MQSTGVLIADDHALILLGIRTLLAPSFQIVGEATDGEQLVEAALRLRPDVVITDVTMPVLNGIEAIRALRGLLPSSKFIVLSMHASPILLKQALDAGASGYVLKSSAAEELRTAIREVLAGHEYVTPGFADEVLTDRTHGGKPARAGGELTDRQRQALALIVAGKTNKEAAEILRVSVKTVEFHRDRLMKRLGAHSVAQLIQKAKEESLID